MELPFLTKTWPKANPAGRLLAAPLDAPIDDFNVLQPDPVFVATADAGIIDQQNGVTGVPDMVAEIISPSSSPKRGRTDKMRLCGRNGSPEFWPTHPNNKRIEVYEKTGSGYALFSFASEEGIITSKVLTGLEVHWRDIFAAG